jgi:PAS domain S-box-containing protein
MVAVAAAAALTLVFRHTANPPVFAFFYAAVALAAWYGGLGAGLAATAAAVLVANWAFLPPYRALSFDSGALQQIGIFTLVALLINSMAAARDRAEGAERRLRRWYEATLASIGDAVIATDPGGRVAFLNAAAESLTGWPRGEAIGRPLSEVSPLVETRSGSAEGKLASGKVGSWNDRMALQARDGREVPVDATMAPIRESQGGIAGAVLVVRDIADRQRAERRLAESEARFRAFMDQTPMIAFLKDEDGRYVWGNAAWARQFPGGADASLGRTDDDLWPPESARQFRASDRAALALGRTVEALESSPGPGGSLVHWMSLKFPVGEPVGRRLVGGIAIDVTERRRTEEALRASEARYRLLFERNQAGVLRSTEAGRIVDCNESFARILGYDGRDEILGHDVGPLYQDALDREAMLARLRSRGVLLDYEIGVRRKDGSAGWVLANLIRLAGEGGDAEIQTTIVDITERKRAEESQRFLAEAGGVLASSLDVDATLDALARLAVPRLADMCLIDLQQDDGSIRRVAAAHADPTKQPLVDELRRRFPPDPDGPHPSVRVLRTGRSEAENEVADALLAETCRDPEHLEIVRALGFRSCMLVPLVARGRTLGVLSLIGTEPTRRYDGSDLSLAEDLARRAGHAADHARMFAEARDARDHAESASRAKDRFLAVLSHELRTPLTPVLAGVDELLLDDGLPPEVRGLLEMVRRNVELEARLIDDLLDVTRIAQGKLTLNRAVVDAHELIHRAVDICLPEVRAKDLDLDLHLAARGHHVEADPARLQQALWNLIKNAVKFNRDGGRLTICTRDEGDRLAVDVSDTGIGIGLEAMPSIFDAFEQGNPTITRQFGGLGLGLAISRSVAELHGGSLTAESPGEGFGSTFTLRLPRALRPDAPAAPTSAGTPGPGRGLRVLVVEDNADTLRILARLLSGRGHRVATAADVASALAAVASEGPFDLVVSDIGLPDGSGLDLMPRLRARGPIRGIALSGYGMEDDLRRSREAGFDVHLIKPVDFAKLEEIIRTLDPGTGPVEVSPA